MMPPLAEPSDLRRAARRGLLLAALWPLAVLLGLGVFAALSVDDALLAEVRAARPAEALAAAIAFVLVFPAMGLRWRALIPGAREAGVGALAISAVAASGQLVGIALPGPVGEVAAAALVRRRWGIAAPLALAASLHARVLGLLTGVVLAGALLAGAPGVAIPDGWGTPLLLGGLVVSGMVAALTVLALFPRVFLRLSAPAWLPGPAARLWAMVGEFLAGAARLGRGVGRPHLEASLWSLLMHVCAGVGVWLLARALGGDPTLAGVLFTQGAISAGALVLFLLPGQALGWDAAYAAFLVAAAGLDPAVAVVTTALARLVQTGLMALGPVALGADLARIDVGQPPDGPEA
jgi:uncharacterized membrane protein YbhN (UPF0104 family)